MSEEITVIGIIGGGVSGLGTAYELRENAIKANLKLKIHIFEQQSDIGGNADTVVVNLGDWRDSLHRPNALHRWADLGVNDINLTAYKRIAKVMKDIGYYDKCNPGKHPKLLPLENTETYFTWDSSVLLSDDEELEHGVSDTVFSIENKDGKKFKFWIKVIHAAADAKVGHGEHLDIKTTVGEYFDSVVSKPKDELEDYVGKKIIDWNDPELDKILEDIRDYIFYPRISAMYFCNDYGPEQMLLAAPMCYYRIQESKGKDDDGNDEKPDRRYFVGGSNSWLVELKENLCGSTKGGNLVDITFHEDYRAEVLVTGSSAKKCTISDSKYPDNSTFKVDYCIVTVHADDAAKLLKFQYENIGASEHAICLRKQETDILQILQSITYTRSIAVCHTYAGLLPANRNQWRTYNILIRQGRSLKPYSMTYLCNRHQNDAGGKHSDIYNQVGLPQFFVTLNPQRDIPDKYVLRTVDIKDISTALHVELPRLSSMSGDTSRYGRLPANAPAIAHFKHNLIDRNCFVAQKELIEYHKTAKNLFFAGGWSNGSGLHEECWQQAQRIAQIIVSH